LAKVEIVKGRGSYKYGERNPKAKWNVEAPADILAQSSVCVKW
jgi:hypothetical protein